MAFAAAFLLPHAFAEVILSVSEHATHSSTQLPSACPDVFPPVLPRRVGIALHQRFFNCSWTPFCPPGWALIIYHHEQDEPPAASGKIPHPNRMAPSIMPTDKSRSPSKPLLSTVLVQDDCNGNPLDLQVDESASPSLVVSDRYRLTQEIARGGMGVVFEAIDEQLGREVAIKVLRRSHSHLSSMQERFLVEARITGRLQHPGIVPIYEVGQTSDGRPFFSMKLVQGTTLSGLLAHRVINQRDRLHHLQAFHRVCQTVAYAHSRGVIHLDIKPSNIMLGPFGEVHLMDWGLCQCLESSELPPCPGDNVHLQFQVGKVAATSTHDAQRDPKATVKLNQVLGTPAYMAPEQARGEPTGPHSDVFGLGAVLCEILTGVPPYLGEKIKDVYRLASHGELHDAMLALKRCGADEALTHLARRCLAIDPQQRPRDAGQVAAEINEFLETSLQRAEHDLARFFDISMDLFCIASLDGYFKRVNSNFSRVLGFSDAELVSRPFLDFVHPEDIKETIEAIQTLSVGNPVVEFRNRYRDAEGNYHVIEWTSKSIPSDNIIFAVARVISGEDPIRKGV